MEAFPCSSLTLELVAVFMSRASPADGPSEVCCTTAGSTRACRRDRLVERTHGRRPWGAGCLLGCADGRSRQRLRSVMRLILDTHAYFWWRADPARLSPVSAEAKRDRSNHVFISSATVWERSIKAQTKGWDSARILLLDLERHPRAHRGIIRHLSCQPRLVGNPRFAVKSQSLHENRSRFTKSATHPPPETSWHARS